MDLEPMLETPFSFFVSKKNPGEIPIFGSFSAKKNQFWRPCFTTSLLRHYALTDFHDFGIIVNKRHCPILWYQITILWGLSISNSQVVRTTIQGRRVTKKAQENEGYNSKKKKKKKKVVVHGRVPSTSC